MASGGPGAAPPKTPPSHACPRQALMSEEDIESLVHRVLQAGDLDGNGRLNYQEFRRMMMQFRDFPAKFRLDFE